jgi:phospholipase/carboxylesterase
LNPHYKNISEPHQNQPVIQSGAELDVAKAVMIMIHGRGAMAENILSLTAEFNIDGVAYLAPQAKGNTWYPFSFLYPVEKNEPGISSGLTLIDSIVNMVLQKGFTSEQIYLLGFSQGACLSLEYVAQNPKKFGGVFGLSGGLIGPALNSLSYDGNLGGVEVFLGCSDVDPHIPLERVHQTEEIFKKLGANVTKRIYKGMAHTVNQDEIDFITALVKSKTSNNF